MRLLRLCRMFEAESQVSVRVAAIRRLYDDTVMTGYYRLAEEWGAA